MPETANPTFSPPVNPFTEPLLRGWRSGRGLTVLRLRVDITGASGVPVCRAGDLVFARWNTGQPPIAKGWVIQDIDFLCVLNEPDVEIIERP